MFNLFLLMFSLNKFSYNTENNFNYSGSSVSFNFFKTYKKCIKKKFFDSIKNFFLFKNNTLQAVYKRHINFYKKLSYLNYNLKVVNTFFKKKNFYNIKFFLPSFLLKNSIKNNINVINNLYKNECTINKNFFRSPKNIYSSVSLQKINIIELFNLLYFINLRKSIKLIKYITKNTFIYINSINYVYNTFRLKTGDCVRVTISKKYITFLLYLIFTTNYNFYLKIYKYTTKNLWHIFKKKINIFFFNLHVYINIEYNYISHSFFFINWYNIKKYNFLYKNFINLYSYRLYNWRNIVVGKNYSKYTVDVHYIFSDSNFYNFMKSESNFLNTNLSFFFNKINTTNLIILHNINYKNFFAIENLMINIKIYIYIYLFLLIYIFVLKKSIITQYIKVLIENNLNIFFDLFKLFIYIISTILLENFIFNNSILCNIIIFNCILILLFVSTFLYILFYYLNVYLPIYLNGILYNKYIVSHIKNDYLSFVAINFRIFLQLVRIALVFVYITSIVKYIYISVDALINSSVSYYLTYNTFFYNILYFVHSLLDILEVFATSILQLNIFFFLIILIFSYLFTFILSKKENIIFTI